MSTGNRRGTGTVGVGMTGDDPRVPRWRRPAVRATAALAVAAAALLVATGPAGASCDTDDPEVLLPTAHVAFVGTVVDLSEGDAWADVRVEEVWWGLDRDEAEGDVEVRGGPEQPDGGQGFVSRSDARRFEQGTRYLIAAQRGGPWGGLLDVTACSATREWDASLARYRPDDAVVLGLGEDALQPATDDDGWSPTPRTWGLVLAGLATALFVLDRVGRSLGNRKLRRDHERATGAARPPGDGGDPGTSPPTRD